MEPPPTCSWQRGSWCCSGLYQRQDKSSGRKRRSRLSGTARRIAQVLPSRGCLNGCDGILAPDGMPMLRTQNSGMSAHAAVQMGPSCFPPIAILTTVVHSSPRPGRCRSSERLVEADGDSGQDGGASQSQLAAASEIRAACSRPAFQVQCQRCRVGFRMHQSQFPG